MQLSKVKILVVDDSEVERLLIKGLLVKNPDYHVEVAADGKQALAILKSRPPHLVITDLMMPEMDGLQLVRTIRQRHPRIPAILMTAYGDESIALDALEAGAASYVPKAQQAERLLDTVQRVAKHAAADRQRARLGKRMIEFHCRYLLDNDIALIRALVAKVQHVMADQGFGDTVERIRTCEALEEALLNAMLHGNLDISEQELAQARMELADDLLLQIVERRRRDPQLADRKILVVAHLTGQEARFVIRDEGRGFNTAFPGVTNPADSFERGRHRGLTLIESLMDEMSFNASGNEMTISKHAAAARV